MSDFTVAFFDRDNHDLQLSMSGLEFFPRSISATWHGGNKDATVDVSGGKIDLWQIFNIMRCGIKIFGPMGQEIWAGMVWGADVDLGYRRYSLSAEEVYNRIRVDYVALSGDGTMESYSTPWVDDAYSQSVYGVREAIRNMSDEADEQLANQRAESELSFLKLPYPERATANGDYGATLHCVGLIKEIDDRYYANVPGGRTSWEPGGGVDHVPGWRLEDSTAGFSEDGYIGGYCSFSETLPPGAVNGQFKVTFTELSNDKTYTIVERKSEVNQVLDTTTNGAGFRWDAGGLNLVEPKTEALNFLGVGQQFDIDISTSSQKDDGNYYGFEPGGWGEPYKPNWTFEGKLNVRDSGSERVACDYANRSYNDVAHDQGGVHDHPKEADGWLHGTLTGAAWLTVTPAPENAEVQNDATTYVVTTVGERVDQLVYVPVGSGGKLWKVAVQIAKIGEPVDSVRLSVWEDNSGNFGAMIDEGFIDAASVGSEKTFRWVIMDHAGLNDITDDTSIHIVIERTGVHDPANYWVLDIAELTGEDSDPAPARFWDGAAWAGRPVAASVPYRVWTGIDLADQIATIIEATRTSIKGVSAIDKAGILVSPYADGERRALDIVSTLLQSGYDGGAEMVLDVTPARQAVIKQAENKETRRIRIGESGRIETLQGARIPSGGLFYGEWVDDVAAPPDVSIVSSMSPILIAEMIFDVRSRIYDISPPGQRDIFDTGLTNA